jgi:hypothetical protein
MAKWLGEELQPVKGNNHREMVFAGKILPKTEKDLLRKSENRLQKSLLRIKQHKTRETVTHQQNTYKLAWW